jgi:hypothetical protein
MLGRPLQDNHQYTMNRQAERQNEARSADLTFVGRGRMVDQTRASSVMNKFLIVLNLSLLLAGGAMYWLLSDEKETNARMARQLSAASQAPISPAAPSSQPLDLHEACRAEAARLAVALSNADTQLRDLRDRLRVLETATQLAAAPPGAFPTAGVRTAVAPARVAPAGPQPPIVPAGFDTLLGANNQVLATNVEVSGLYGRRVAFKDRTGSGRMAFDVDQLASGVLAKLGIDAEEAKAVQAQQDEVWKKAQLAARAMAAAEAKRKQERKAADEAAWAEEQKQIAQQMQQMQNQAFWEPAPPPPPSPPVTVPVPYLLPYPVPVTPPTTTGQRPRLY